MKLQDFNSFSFPRDRTEKTSDKIEIEFSVLLLRGGVERAGGVPFVRQRPLAQSGGGRFPADGPIGHGLGHDRCLPCHDRAARGS